MNRLQQKHDLFIKLGMLFGPLQRIVDHPEGYDDQEKAEAQARYFASFRALTNEVRAFCIGQDGHDYAIEYHRFSAALKSVQTNLINGQDFFGVVRGALSQATTALDAIPIPRTSVIVEAGSPFTAYCRLRELCEADATKSLVWLDPYMSATVFSRYISNTRDSIPVTLVTQEPGPRAGNQNLQRWNDFLDVSRLFAAERGPQLYRLVVNKSLHDRWAIFDDKRIYSLGGSSKDAGNRDYFTIAVVEGTSANLQIIQDQISCGDEYFGPSTAAHK